MATALPVAPFMQCIAVKCEFCCETHLISFEDPADALAVQKEGFYPCEECETILLDLLAIEEMKRDGTASKSDLLVESDLRSALAKRMADGRGGEMHTANPPRTFN